VVPIEIQILIGGVRRGEIAWASMPETLGTPTSVSRKYSLRVRSLTARPERARSLATLRSHAYWSLTDRAP
jgi:hypothetical protein